VGVLKIGQGLATIGKSNPAAAAAKPTVVEADSSMVMTPPELPAPNPRGRALQGAAAVGAAGRCNRRPGGHRRLAAPGDLHRAATVVETDVRRPRRPQLAASRRRDRAAEAVRLIPAGPPPPGRCREPPTSSTWRSPRGGGPGYLRLAAVPVRADRR
jgi:hypothetical protein